MRSFRTCGALVLFVVLTAQVTAYPEPLVTLQDSSHPFVSRSRFTCRITADNVQHLAVRNTPLGAVLEPKSLPTVPHPWLDIGGTMRARRELLYQARVLAAEDLRNQNAGTALELFWKLTVNLDRCRLLELGRAELVAQQARLDEAIAKELKAPRDRDDLAIKASRLASDEITLRTGLEQLHDQLALLIGWKAHEPPAFQPASTLRVGQDVLNPEQSVAIGLERRADLRLLRLLETSVDSRTLPVVQTWMTSINPLLASAQMRTIFGAVLRLLAVVPLEGNEVNSVRDQLRILREFREQQTRYDILRQVEIIKLKYRDALETRQRHAILRERYQAFAERVAKDLSSEVELSPLRLELWKGEADLVQAAVDWELARVQLRQLQGVLTTEPIEGGCPVITPAAVVPGVIPDRMRANFADPPPAFTIPQSCPPSGTTSGVTSGVPGGP